MKIPNNLFTYAVHLAGVVALSVAAAAAQAPSSPSFASHNSAPGAPVVPADFVFGPDDVVSVLFWRDKDMSADVTVRPDGRISLPLINDIQAAGLTPEQLRRAITDASAKYLDDPTVTVIVKAINSRRVFITGQVTKPGEYSLTAPTTVLQLVAMSGGVLEYADAGHIVVMRTTGGRSESFPFNYNDVIRRKNLQQNIELRPGDTVVVP